MNRSKGSALLVARLREAGKGRGHDCIFNAAADCIEQQSGKITRILGATRHEHDGARMQPAMLSALRHAWAGNRATAEAYALLAADHLEAQGEADQARYLRMAIDELTGKTPITRVRAA